jgi:hypothetical protein
MKEEAKKAKKKEEARVALAKVQVALEAVENKEAEVNALIRQYEDQETAWAAKRKEWVTTGNGTREDYNRLFPPPAEPKEAFGILDGIKKLRWEHEKLQCAA